MYKNSHFSLWMLIRAIQQSSRHLWFENCDLQVRTVGFVMLQLGLRPHAMSPRWLVHRFWQLCFVEGAHSAGSGGNPLPIQWHIEGQWVGKGWPVVQLCQAEFESGWRQASSWLRRCAPPVDTGKVSQTFRAPAGQTLERAPVCVKLWKTWKRTEFGVCFSYWWTDPSVVDGGWMTLYQKLDNLNETAFCKAANHLNWLNSKQKIWTGLELIKHVPTTKSLFLENYTGEFYQMFKME